MKFIKFKLGKGVYHIAKENTNIHMLNSHKYVSSCDNNYPREGLGDSVTDNPPIGRLCARCKRRYLVHHTEDELFTEML